MLIEAYEGTFWKEANRKSGKGNTPKEM